jgi:ribosomal protein S12 methylthiotransferase
MLKLMRRKSTKEDILTLIEDIRNYYPDFVIRTTVIVGYPGETEELFENMLKTLEKLEFDKLGVFKYCDENDVYSYMLPNKVDEEIKDFRYDSIMAQQQKISFKSCSKYVGKTLKVLVDGYDEETDTIISRDEFNSPEIDGSILFQTKKNIDIMDFFYITITGNDDYDLIGELNNV